jgi:hypothetical protein
MIAALLGIGLTLSLMRFLAPRAERYGLPPHSLGRQVLKFTPPDLRRD